MKKAKTTAEEDVIRNDTLKVLDTGKGKLIDFFLTEEIVSIEDYIDFLRECNDAHENDIIRVHINCYGGDVNVALNIYDVLKATEANVEADIEGMCASAATMIMLAANTWRVYPHCCVMIHAWTSWTYGKWNELKDSYKFNEDVWEPQFRDIYKNFLTEKEIQQCLDGKDFWFSCEETSKRLNDFQADAMAKQDKIDKIIDKYQKLMANDLKKIENGETASLRKALKQKKE